MPLTAETYQRIVVAKAFIDEHFGDTIDLVSMAERAYMSRFHFHRLFTSIYHITPHQYLTRKRITKASELLGEDRLSITEICNSIGFESLASFSTLFKKEMGSPPQYYRNMAWKKKQEARRQPLAHIPHCFVDAYQLASNT